jgi:outer membrane receptor protein involved in Fe transport
MAAWQAHAQAAATPAPTKDAPAKPPAKGKAPPKTVEGVTVTGASQNGMRTSIDRRSYGIATDLATTTGSVSDALKNIPSVEVDVQGNVSLRGDTNVTILIDGKPSGMFKGASAAQALQAMPADSVERVEVITNPSAEFSPEGAAGIINLITKKTRKAGRSGSVRLNVGTGGRYNGGATASYNSRNLTLTADIGARRDDQSGQGDDARAILDGAGRVLSASTTHWRQFGFAEQRNARTSVDYDLDDKTRLSAEARYFHFGVAVSGPQSFVSLGPTGAATGLFNQRFGVDIGHDTGAAQATFLHKFDGEDHQLTVNVSRERTDEDRTTDFDQVNILPVAPDIFTSLRSKTTLTLTEAKADYTRPMPAEAKLKAGYDLRIDQNDYDNVGVRGVTAGDAGPDPTQTNLFLYRQTVNAAYATYEQPFGDWTVLGGLRIENVNLHLDQVTSRLIRDSGYFKIYPSLHLAYRFAEDRQLTLSYSKRVQRPNPQDLNPFPVENDALSFRAGNPNLQPQITHSFEAAYQYKSGQTIYLGTLYYRQNEHGVTDVVTSLGDGVFLTTKENLSQSRAAGLELVANGHITKDLSYNLSSNFYWNEVDAGGRGLDQLVDVSGRRSAFAAGGRGSITWQATPKDMFQLSAQMNAKRLTPQGYMDPNFVSFLGYRHKLNDSLSVAVTVQDVFRTVRFQQVVDTPTLRDRSSGRPNVQAAFIGFTWNFGVAGKRPRDQGFDFGGAAPPQ